MIALAHAPISPGQGHEMGRTLLRQLYLAHRGGDMPPIICEERGKPRFAGSDLHFSITHTPHHVFCALSDRPIGIDAEEEDRKLSLRIAKKILSPTELAQFEAADDPHRALLTFWVLKEAAAKQTGHGINSNPNTTAFSLHDPRVQPTEGCLLAIIE